MEARKSCVSHWTGDLVSRRACIHWGDSPQNETIYGYNWTKFYVFYQKHSHFSGEDDCIVSFWKTLNKLLNSVRPYDIFLNHAASSQFFDSARIHGKQKKHSKMGPKELYRWIAPCEMLCFFPLIWQWANIWDARNIFKVASTFFCMEELHSDKQAVETTSSRSVLNKVVLF